MTDLLKNDREHTRLSIGGDCDCKIVPSATLIPTGKLAVLAVSFKASV